MNWQLPYGAHPLAPFDHQVAGQSSMLRYDDTTVCKPLIAREYFVYQALPVGLKDFTPEYRGEIEVHLAEKDGFLLLYCLGVHKEPDDLPCDYSSEEGYSHPTSTVKEDTKQNDSLNTDIIDLKNVRAPPNQCMIRVLRSESYEVCSPVQGMDQGDVMAPHPSGLNPWSLKNHKRLLDKMRKSEYSQNSIRFILLKNAVADFKCPCVLDLKIGSRLHGDEADEVKVQSQSRKCRETTSSSIGLRLSGMQVYQKNTGTFTSYDKYYGRTLNDDTFKKTLISFLHNGFRSRTELLPPIISQLSKLIRCLENINSYRFYASSLLIIYDGEETGNLSSVPASLNVNTKDTAERKNDLNLAYQTPTQTGSELVKKSSDDISSAHIKHSDTCMSGKKTQLPLQSDSRSRHQDQHSCTSQISSAVSSQLLSHQKLSCEHFDSEELNLGTRKSTCEPSLNDSSSLSPSAVSDIHTAQGQSLSGDLSPSPLSFGKVDVKMIDFAHTTHEGFPNDKIRHQGPDMDYIRGLNNLKKLFEQLLNVL